MTNNTDSSKASHRENASQADGTLPELKDITTPHERAKMQYDQVIKAANWPVDLTRIHQSPDAQGGYVHAIDFFQKFEPPSSRVSLNQQVSDSGKLTTEVEVYDQNNNLVSSKTYPDTKDDMEDMLAVIGSELQEFSK